MKQILYFESSFYANNRLVQQGVYRYARFAKWKVQIVPYAGAAKQQCVEVEGDGRPDIKGLLDFWHPAGVLVDCGAAPDLLRQKDFGDTPAVFIDRRPGPSWNVCVSDDPMGIAKIAAHELLSLGLPHYGYVPWLTHVPWSRDRGELFGNLVRMNGYGCQVFPNSGGSVSLKTHCARLCEWLKALPKPCGILAANDAIGARVLLCAARCRIRVPDELAVIGVDNDSQTCECATPTLTSIGQDHERAGYLGAQLLDAWLSKPSHRPASETYGPLAISRRASTCVIRRRDAKVASAIELIRRRACEPLRAHEVVATMGCSRRLAEQRFREVTGRSILEEIQHVRIDRAVYLLEHSAEPISRVAELCGYRSTESLRKVFCALKGHSPADWRRFANGR